MCDVRGKELNEGGKPWWGRRCGSRAGACVNPQVPALFCSLLSSLHMHEHRSSPCSQTDSYVQETVSPAEEMGSARRRARVHLSKQKRRGKKLGLAQSALGNICTHAHAHTHTHTPPCPFCDHKPGSTASQPRPFRQEHGSPHEQEIFARDLGVSDQEVGGKVPAAVVVRHRAI